MHPWGDPVLSIRVTDVLLPSFTTWGWPVRKSRIQLQREVFSPRILSLEGTMLLNPKLYSMKGILTQVFLLSRRERAVWSAIEVGWSAWVVCKLEWVQGFLDNSVDVSHYQPFKALHGYGREYCGSVVIQAGCRRVLGHMDSGPLLVQRPIISNCHSCVPMARCVS